MEKSKVRYHDFTLEDDPITYRLCFDFNKMCEAESQTGLNLMGCVLGIEAFTCNTARGMLFGLLKMGHPAVLLTEAADLVSRDMRTVLDKLSEVLTEVRGIPEESPDKPAPDKPAAEPAPEKAELVAV